MTTRAARVALAAALATTAGAARAHAAECDSNLMIVLDRSCSMDRLVAGDTRTKWEISVEAIDKLTTDYADRLRFGLIMFPDEEGERCTQDGPIYVNLGDDNEAAVRAAVAGTQPDGPCVTNIDTAIGQVLDDPELGAVPDPVRRSFVLLITDGKQSNACGGLDKDPDTEALIADLNSRGYPTYVVGFGDGVRPASLETFALAGGVPRVGDPVYFQADTAAELEAAIAAIAGDIGGDPEFGTCLGLPCPDGVCFGSYEVCESGTCITHLPDAGPTPDAGDLGSDAGIGDDGDGSGADGELEAGCGCAAGDRPDDGSGALVLMLIAAAFIARRR